MNSINQIFEKYKDEIIGVRRELHRHPELSFGEYRTADAICSFLDKHNIKYRRGIAETGVCACFGSGEKCILLRADMDALPINEETGLEFASENSGVMHACGHDIHMSVALACACVLKEIENTLGGCVKIIFQPAEETTGGALPMINEGILESPHVCAAIGGHVTPQLAPGKIWIRSGAMTASPDDFTVTFIGKSTHGAQPQLGVSPIMPAAEFALNAESRVLGSLHSDEQCVLSVCTVSADGGCNIIPESAAVVGTFRGFSNEDRKSACESIENLAKELCRKYKTRYEFNYNFLYPPIINDSEMTECMKKTIAACLGDNAAVELEKPLMTGEDFSYICERVPSTFVWYGAGGKDCAPLHSARFCADESAIGIMTNVFCGFILNYLK